MPFLDPVDETFFEFVEACLNHVQTPVLQRKFAALGGVDLLVRLCSMSVNDDVIVKACRALWMLLQMEGEAEGGKRHAVVNAMKIKAAGGLSALMAQLRRSRNDSVLAQASGALRALTEVYVSNRDMQGAEGWGTDGLNAGCADYYQVILSLLRHTQNTKVHAVVGGLLLLATQMPEELPKVVRSEAVEIIVRQCGHQRNPEILLPMLNTLCVLVAEDVVRQRFTGCGGVEALVSVLNSGVVQTEWDNVRSSAANVLANLMAGQGRSVHEYQTSVGAAGGVEALLRVCGRAVAGATDTWHSRLVEQTTGALCNVSFENDAQRVKLGELGACELFCRVCKACDGNMAGHQRTLEQACAVLGNVAKKNRTNRIKIGKARGPEALAGVLMRLVKSGGGADVEPVAMQALRAIGNILMRCDDNQEDFADAGGCKPLVQYCFGARGDAMLRRVLVTMLALAGHETVRYRLVKDGAIAAAAAVASNSFATEETKEVARKLQGMLPLPAPVVGCKMLAERGEEVMVETGSGRWVRTVETRMCAEAGAATIISKTFAQGLEGGLGGGGEAAVAVGGGGASNRSGGGGWEEGGEEGGVSERRRVAAGFVRVRLRVRDREFACDAIVDGSGPEDIIVGEVGLARLKSLGFEHMVHQYYTM